MIAGNKTNEKQRSSAFRKSLIIPAEHGAWSWLLVPLLTGIAVARELNVAVFLVTLGALSAFLVRQPATVWLRIRRGRGRRSDERLAAGWTVGLGAMAALCFVILLLVGYTALLPLLIPLAFIFAAYLYVARAGRARTRSLLMELAGAAGLAAAAPAGYVAASGRLDAIAWLLWVVLAAQNLLGVLYVRQRIADTHGRDRRPWLLVTSHLGGLLLILALSVVVDLPALVALPFLAFLARAAWAGNRRRPVDNIRRFGFLEVAVEVASGLWIVIAFWGSAV